MHHIFFDGDVCVSGAGHPALISSAALVMLKLVLLYKSAKKEAFSQPDSQ